MSCRPCLRTRLIQDVNASRTSRGFSVEERANLSEVYVFEDREEADLPQRGLTLPAALIKTPYYGDDPR